MGINDNVDIQELVVDRHASGWFSRIDGRDLERHEASEVIARFQADDPFALFRTVRADTPSTVLSMSEALAISNS